MEITARLTGDATISTLKSNRQVVNFNVALNDSYKPKGSNDAVRLTTYVQCSYWINSSIAQYLSKGILVTLQGRIGVNPYMGKDGHARASLTFHANAIKIHGRGNSKKESSTNADEQAKTKSSEDLPF